MAARRRPTGPAPPIVGGRSPMSRTFRRRGQARRPAPASDAADCEREASLQFQAALDGGADRRRRLWRDVRGRSRWRAGLGRQQRRRARRAHRLTPDSAMVIGSVTKTFVAATVLELVDEGRSVSTTPCAAFLPSAPGEPRDHDPPTPRPHQRPRRRLQRHDPTRAWRSTRSTPGPRDEVLGDPPCPVVPAG